MVTLETRFFEINSWSFTKHRIWNQCRRQYYYQYIAPYLKAPAPVDINKILLLKEYDSRFVLEGQLIHDILNDQIKLHCDKKPLDPNGAIEFYLKKIALNKMMAGEIFTEYRNGSPIDPFFFKKIEDDGKECLNMFFEKIWPEYKSRECLRHEEYDKFKIKNFEVTVKVDFISKLQNDTIVLTDWKTGADKPEYEAELQMASYVIWAMQHYRRGADEIMSELVFLNSGERKPFPFFEERLLEVQELIENDFKNMNASYELDDFPPRPHLRECISCKFGKFCPESKILKIF